MKAATPGEPHQKLQSMEGHWNVHLKSWAMPGAPAMESDGSAEMSMVLGGRYLRQTFTGDFMGMPFEGLGYIGYDNVKKQYFNSWMDNMSTGMMITSGHFDPAGMKGTFEGTMTDPMGGEMSVKEVLHLVDRDHHTMEMWGPGPDGQTFKMMEISYSRKK